MLTLPPLISNLNWTIFMQLSVIALVILFPQDILFLPLKLFFETCLQSILLKNRFRIMPNF
ncbi:hypothetical protein CK934_14570 [Chitinophaga sp. MD30]|nr:hypothetical protein CK934_14570 [Chitinophaga sp. MD30]